MSKKDKSSRLANSLTSISRPLTEDYEMLIKKTKSDEIKIDMVDIENLYPAPEEWNFFPRLSDMKMLEMMFSIMENGLFNPIIIWERDSGSYMILSGHNRVNAFKRIREEYQDDEFNKIPSIIYKKDEIDEKKAQEIIIDTNYIQREEDLSILPLIVKHRKEYIEKQKDRKGNTLMMVAQELNIGRTRAFKLGKIATDIIPELAELYYNKVLTQDNALKFSWYNKGVQKKIYDKYGDKINNETVNALKKDMSEAEIRQVFNRGKGEKISNILFKVPEDEAEDLREFVMEYLSVDMDKRKDIKKAMTYYLLMSNEDIKRHLDMLGEKKGVRL